MIGHVQQSTGPCHRDCILVEILRPSAAQYGHRCMRCNTTGDAHIAAQYGRRAYWQYGQRAYCGAIRAPRILLRNTGTAGFNTLGTGRDCGQACGATRYSIRVHLTFRVGGGRLWRTAGHRRCPTNCSGPDKWPGKQGEISHSGGRPFIN